ncbi:exopolyphosphatase PRUNE1-like isoform X1 [Sycon ciliatum]|uniref:exopolyphosphatase PRUNE1-like isoform X1 n=1 Tax=Sycon ciliatum TaxID=27933 RepID=UPI0031F6C0BF
MEEFLRDAKHSLENLGDDKSVHAVLGNESCDLDSVACSIAYAYYLKQVNPSGTVIAVVDCTREELELRREVISLCEHLGISADSFIYYNDVDITSLKSNGALKMTIVDHNSLSSRWKLLEANLVEIIDHHKDSKEAGESVSVSIEPVGSCSTLVAEKILSADTGIMDAALATLLLSTILLDTVNLDSEAGRTTDKDREIADLLSQIAGQDTGAQVFERLRKVKFDVSSLSSYELLGKDYKPVGLCSTSAAHVGISSVTCGLEQFLSRTTAKDAMCDFLLSKEINCLVLMSIYFPEGEDKPRRQVGVYSDDEAVRDEVILGLQSDGVLQLDAFSPDQALSGLVCFNQGNRAASRKILLPLLACSLSIGSSSAAPVSPAVTPVDAVVAIPGESDRAALLSDTSFHSTPAVLQTETSLRPSTPIQEYTADEEAVEERTYKAVGVAGVPASVDLKAIEKYRNVVSHGGYQNKSKDAIIVLSACHLPPKNIPNYNHVMEQLFLYVVSVVQHLAVDNYCIVLFNTDANLNNTPGITWLHKYYSGVDRHLRKNLQNLYIFNPTLRLKVLFQLARPFISAKFWRKVTYVRSLAELKDCIPLENVAIPRAVLDSDTSGAFPRTAHEVSCSLSSEKITMST